jgi:hypothetical protein
MSRGLWPDTTGLGNHHLADAVMTSSWCIGRPTACQESDFSVGFAGSKPGADHLPTPNPLRPRRSKDRGDNRQ